MPTSPTCEICQLPIEGGPFHLPSGTAQPRVLSVCRHCAGAESVRVCIDTTTVEINRDDYLRADQDRLEQAVHAAYLACENLGWSLEGLTLRAESDEVSEPYEH